MPLAPDDPGRFGPILWERPLSGSSFRPALHGDVVFAGARGLGSYDHRLQAHDPATGAVRWQLSSRSFFFAGARWVRDGLAAVTTSEATVLGVDVRDGTVRWTRKLGRLASSAHDSIPTLFGAIDGAIHYVSPNGREAGALDPRTGRRVWKRRMRGSLSGVWPAFGLVGEAAGTCFEVIAIEGDEVRWSVQGRPKCTTSDAVLVEEADQLVLRAVDDGTVRWTTPRTWTRSSSCIAAGTIMVGLREDGDMWILEARALDTAELKWRRELGPREETYRLLAGHHGDVCFIDDPLEALVAETGETVGTLADLQAVVRPHPTPQVSGGRVLVEGRRKDGTGVLQIREWVR